jgi:hypothetical protein
LITPLSHYFLFHRTEQRFAFTRKTEQEKFLKANGK